MSFEAPQWDGSLGMDEHCPMCDEPIAYIVMGARMDKKVCLECKPISDSPPYDHVYYVEDGKAWPRRFSRDEGPFYFCHTARPGHEQFRRS